MLKFPEKMKIEAFLHKIVKLNVGLNLVGNLSVDIVDDLSPDPVELVWMKCVILKFKI